jgi:glutathione S-transferase
VAARRAGVETLDLGGKEIAQGLRALADAVKQAPAELRQQLQLVDAAFAAGRHAGRAQGWLEGGGAALAACLLVACLFRSRRGS